MVVENTGNEYEEVGQFLNYLEPLPNSCRVQLFSALARKETGRLSTWKKLVSMASATYWIRKIRRRHICSPEWLTWRIMTQVSDFLGPIILIVRMAAMILVPKAVFRLIDLM